MANNKIVIPPVNYESLPGMIPPIAQKAFKGINKLDPFSIDETFSTDTKNLTSSGFPSLKTRPGYTLLGSVFAARILGLGLWKESELHAISNANWYKWSGSAWSASLLAGISTTANWSFCNFKGGFADYNLIGSNGSMIKKYGGGAITDLVGAPAGGNYVDTHDNRVYCAKDNFVHFSALRLAEDWTDPDPYVGAGATPIETASGRNIIGLKAGAGHIVSYLPNSTHELYGTGPDDYRLVPIANDIGLISNQCVVNIAGVLYWLHETGIYRYTGGVRPKKDFSLPVQYYVDGINQTYKAKCSAGTDGKRLYISIPYGAATEPNITLEYDPEFSGIWYVWENFTALAFANSASAWYQGDSAGKVMQMGGTTDNGTAISWRWVSVPFGSRLAAQNIRWHKMWIRATVPIGSTCSIYLSKLPEGDTDWVLVKTMIPSASLQKQKAMINIASMADANYLRVKFEGSGPIAIHEFDRQSREMPTH